VIVQKRFFEFKRLNEAAIAKIQPKPVEHKSALASCQSHALPSAIQGNESLTLAADAKASFFRFNSTTPPNFF
jgi:hypothetical protein